MPHSFIPEAPVSSEHATADGADEVELSDQFTAKQVAQAPITADLEVSAKAQNISARQEIAPVTPVAKPPRSRTRILTPLLIILLFVIAVPTAWVLGQMQTATTTSHTAGGAVIPASNTTPGTLTKQATDFPTATSQQKGTQVPGLSVPPAISPTPLPSPLPLVHPTPATTSARPVPPRPFPGNIVQDPGYEMQGSTQVAPPWVEVGTGSIVSNQTRSGNNAARIVPTVDNSWSDIEQTVSVKTNTNYTLSVYIYTSNTLNTDATIFDVIAVHGPNLQEVHYFPAPSGYTQISLTFNSQSYTAVTIRIGFVGQENMWVQADDWYLHS